MKNKHLRIKRLSFGLIAGLVVAISGQIGYAYGAYLDSTKIQNNTQFNTQQVSEYFQGGTGTEDDPYQISTAGQLRNMQRLNVLGVFNASSNFILNNNIDWSGDPLIPIGSDDYPFDCQFNGAGKTINNLVVNGANTRDVGMFGYTSFSAHVKNLLLSHPTINVNVNSDGGTDSSDNPLSSYLDSAAQGMNLLTTANSSKTVVVGNSNLSFDYNGQTVTLPLTWTSSDTTVLSSTDNTNFTITTPATDKLTNNLYTVQLSATTSYVMNGKLIKYTAERFNVEVTNGGVVNPDNAPYKNMWPAKGSEETVADDYYYHKTYVGFFVGHSDGGTAYLGLIGGNSQSTTSNGSIVVNGRAAYSYGTLIGKTRSDNPKDNTASNNYNKYFDFSALTKQYTYTAPSYPVGTGDFAINKDFKTPDYNYSIYETTNARTLTDVTTGETTTSQYARIYPSTDVDLVTYKGLDEADYTRRAAKFTGPLQAGTYFQSVKVMGSKYYALARGTYVNNGIWIWSSSSTQTFFSGISGLDEFYVTINLTYVARNCTDNEYFQVMYNAYNPDIQANYAVFWNYNETHVKYALWPDLYAQNDADNEYYVPQKVVDSNDDTSKNGYIQEKSLSIHYNKAGKLWGSLGSLFSSGTWSPAFAIGVGTAGSFADHSSNKAVSTDSGLFAKGVTAPSTSDCPCVFNSGYSVPSNFELDVLNMEILFTSSKGNVSSHNNFTDYIYDSSSLVYDSTTKTFTTWNTESNVKVGFNVGDNGVSSTYSFYRTAGWGSGVGSAVYGLYNNGNYVPFNTNGYKSANFTAV